MFIEASERAQSSARQVEDELHKRLDHIDKTAATWYDDTSATVENRRDDLYRTGSLCQRVAALATTADEDATDLLHIRDQFMAQAKQLDVLASQLKGREYQAAHGDAPVFSSQALTDESRTAVRRSTDWDLYLGTEPREFVAHQSGISGDELRIRAFNHIEDAMYGHGLSRQAKVSLAQAFLTEVEAERHHLAKQRTAKSKPTAVQYDDSALFL